jgi:hypothetical protein
MTKINAEHEKNMNRSVSEIEILVLRTLSAYTRDSGEVQLHM